MEIEPNGFRIDWRCRGLKNFILILKKCIVVRGELILTVNGLKSVATIYFSFLRNFDGGSQIDSGSLGDAEALNILF